MSGWNTKSKTLNEAVKHTFTYDYPGDKTIETVSVSCGCTAAIVDGNQINLTYSGCTVSYTFKDQGWQNITKTATINFTDGSKEKISFTVKCLSS